MYKKLFSCLLSAVLFIQQPGFGQQIVAPAVVPGERFRPQHLRALEIDRQTGGLNVVLDRGDSVFVSQERSVRDAQELMRYVHDAVRFPDSAFWVNLRPDGDNEIIDPLLERSDIGKIMLEADVQLKRDLARMTDPDTAEGKDYWDKLYTKAESLFGPQEDSVIPTLARPWIVPGEIILAENDTAAYIFKATLKVMLEQDYLRQSLPDDDQRLRILNEYAAQLLRSRILPALTRKVNAGRAYAPLRQVYYSLILAQWYKRRFPSNRDVSDVTSSRPWSKMTYFNAYKQSFQQGEYHKERTAFADGQMVVRQYASGGLSLGLDDRGSIGSLNIGTGLAVLKQVWSGMAGFVEVRLPGVLNRRPQPPQAVLDELAGVSSKLNRHLKEYALFNRSATTRRFKDFTSAELSGIWAEYKDFILKHIAAGEMPVLEDFRPFPALEQSNLRFAKHEFDWYSRETSLTNVPLLILFDPVKKIAYSVPVDTLAVTEKEVFNYDLADLLEMVGTIPEDERARLQLRVGWGTNRGLRGFYLIEGENLVEFKGYTLNRIKTDEVYRTDDPAMALTKDLGELEARCLRSLGFMEAECSKPLGTHQMVIQEPRNGEITKEFTLVQLRREGKLGSFGSPLGRMVTMEEMAEVSGIDDRLAQTQYYRSGKNFGEQLRVLHEKLWFNGYAENGWYHASWHHAANVDYLGNIIDLIPYSFKSITGEDFNPLNPAHELALYSWAALDLERFFIGAPPENDWADWGFIGNTSSAFFKKAFLQGFVQGYLPGFDYVPDSALELSSPGRLESLVSRIYPAFGEKALAVGQNEYGFHGLLAAEFTQRFLAEQKTKRRYGEESSPGLSADIPPSEGSSSIRDGGTVLSEAFLLRHADKSSAAQDALKKKEKELSWLSQHVSCDVSGAALGPFAEFMLFGAAGPAFSRKSSFPGAFDDMVNRIASVTSALSGDSVRVDSVGAKRIGDFLEQGFDDIRKHDPIDSERFLASYAMAAVFLYAQIESSLPGLTVSSGLLKYFSGEGIRGQQIVELCEEVAAGESAPSRIAGLSDFIASEHADLYGLAVDAQGWADSAGFLRHLLQRRDKKVIDLFADLDSAGVWDEETLKTALEQLLGCGHTNNNYRLKRKALSFVLRICQVANLSSVSAERSNIYHSVSAALNAYAGERDDKAQELSANMLLDSLRQELVAAARSALKSEVFSGQWSRRDIGSVDWMDEQTLEQVAYMVSVYAQSRKREHFGLTDRVEKVMDMFIAWKDRARLNGWLNGALPDDRGNWSWNREVRLLLEEGGYDPLFFSDKNIRDYAIGEKLYRMSLDFDFFNQATAGEEVPSCFNPTSAEGGHMPLFHALDTGSAFLSVTDDAGRRIADAVVFLAPEGLVVQKLYTRGPLDLDQQVFDYFVHLVEAGMVPAVFWQKDSPGLNAGLKSGIGRKVELSLAKELFVSKEEVYFENSFFYGNRAEFPCVYSLTAQGAAGYRVPQTLERADAPAASPAQQERRIGKDDKARITRELFSLGLQHIDLGPVLQNIEMLIFDDPSSARLRELAGGLRTKDPGAAITDDQRARVQSEVETIKASYGVSARDGGASEERLQQLMKSLNGGAINKRLEAMYELGHLKEPRAVDPLIRILRTATFMEAQVAAAALGMIGDRRAAEPLIEALDNINPPVRKHAAVALGQLGAPEALERLCDLAVNDEEAHQDAVKALTMFLENAGDADAAFSLVKRLGESNVLPFDVYAWFMEKFLFGRLEKFRDTDVLWLAEKTGLPEDVLRTVACFAQARDFVRAMREDGVAVAYSGDEIWLSLEAARMFARHADEQSIWQAIDASAAYLARMREFLPSIGTEIEVFDEMINGGPFDVSRARRICSWLGVDVGGDGLIEYAVNPTSFFIQQAQIKDFLRACGLLPQGFFPVHINLGVSGSGQDSAFEDAVIDRYIAAPLGILYAVDRRLTQDKSAGNFFGVRVGIKDAAEGSNGTKRIELRPNMLVHSDNSCDYRGVYGPATEAFVAALRSSSYLVAAWTAYAKQPSARNALEETLAREFVRYMQAIDEAYAHEEPGLAERCADALLNEGLMSARSQFPLLQEGFFQAISAVAESAEAMMEASGIALPGLSADIPAFGGSRVPAVTVVRPDYATGLLGAVLDKAESMMRHLVSDHPGLIEEALHSMGKGFTSANGIDSVVLEYHDSGFYKHTFKATIHSGEESRQLLFMVKTDTKAIRGLFEKGEWAMWQALQGTGLVPRIGFVVGDRASVDNGHTFALVELIEGQNVFELTSKTLFDYEYGKEQDLPESISRSCLSAAVEAFLRLNRDILRTAADLSTADCRGPYDFHQQNIIIEKGSGRAVMVDLGRQRAYQGIHDYLALSIGLYLDYDEQRPEESARPLKVLSERWPEIDWHAVLTGTVKTLQERKEQYASRQISSLNIAGFPAKAEDIDNVIALIQAYLREHDASGGSAEARRGAGPASDGGSDKGGIDLRGTAVAGASMRRQLPDIGKAEMALLLDQLRAEELQGAETCKELKEKLIGLTK